MFASNWITLAAVVVALLMGVASIWQTRRIQKKEYKRRLLGEIINWATDVVKCEFESEIPVEALLSSEEEQEKRVEHIDWVTHGNLRLRYAALDARSAYIEEVSKAFTWVLSQRVRGTIGKLRVHMGILRDYLQGETNRKEYKEHLDSLRKSAVSLINEAAKIAVRDIG